MARHFSTSIVDEVDETEETTQEDEKNKIEETTQEDEETETKTETEETTGGTVFRLVIDKSGNQCFMPIASYDVISDEGSVSEKKHFDVGQMVWIVVAILATISLVCCSISCATRRASVATAKVPVSESVVTDDAVAAAKAPPVSKESTAISSNNASKNDSVAGALDALATEKTEGGTNHGA